MNSFTMIPDALMKSKSSRGAGDFTRRYLIALLVRASGVGTVQYQWRDLSISGMATMTGLSRQTVSKHWNYIVNNWVEYSLPIIDRAYPGLDTVALTAFMDRVHAIGRTRIPCVKGLNTYVSKKLTQREEEKTKTTKTSFDESVSIDKTTSQLVSEEESSDSTDRGETERQDPVRSRRDGRRVLLGGGRESRQTRPTDDDWILSLVEAIEDREEL
jgi:hypothetical protein